ncbi:tetratricopeptide repeat-containing sensor histidine kinase [Aureibaculum conchae]|uniref:tetratricopeptide repeat-containing sensor histidine kinase n=1 Tax=Aureibaculum sp. 2308TA14-22 TaxID=3108392 RepID=UPI00339B9B14
MLQKLSFFFLLFVFTNTAFSQNKVLDSLENQLKLHQKKDTLRVKLLINAANNCQHESPEKALKYIDEARQIAEHIDWLKGKAAALRQKGIAYYYQADTERAMDIWQEALKVAEPLNDKIFNASIYNNLASIFADMKQNDRALEEYNKLLIAAKEANHKPYLINALSNIGVVYNDINESEKALPYLKEALEIAESEQSNYFAAVIKNNLGLVFLKQKKYLEAKKQFENAASMAISLKNKYIEASARNSIGKIDLQLNNFKEAEIESKKALLLAKEIDAVEWQAESWQVLSKVYTQKEDYKEAFTAYQNYIQFRDSVFSEDKKAEITRKDMQFQLEKKEALADAEIKRQKIIRNSAMAGGGILLLTAILSGVFYKKRRDDAEKIKLSKFEAKVADTELKALRAQMNPHFIFNSLNSINDFIAKNNTKQANDYLIKFSKLTRAILENSDKKWISLEEEIELSELYMQLESYRLKDKFSYRFNIDDKIDKENTLIPPLILQPFIENSIWHGIAPLNGDGNIEIGIKEKNNMLICMVDDNGVGRKASNNRVLPKESKGISITKSRLDILGKGSVDFIDKTKGLTVTLTLPLKHQF